MTISVSYEEDFKIIIIQNPKADLGYIMRHKTEGEHRALSVHAHMM